MDVVEMKKPDRDKRYRQAKDVNSTIPARLGTLPAGRLSERAVPAQLCLPSGAMPQMITRKSFHLNIMLPPFKIIYYPPWNMYFTCK